MNITIKANRIRILREASRPKKLSQEGLAKLAKLGKRQIQRIEQNNGDLQIREVTLDRLSKALQVEQGVLTGEKPMPADLGGSANFAAAIQTVTVRLPAHLKLQFDLVEQTYGASFQDLVSFAPALFVHLAERSLVWREKHDEHHWDSAESVDTCDVFGDLLNDIEPWEANPLVRFFYQEVASQNLKGMIDFDRLMRWFNRCTYYEGHHVPVMEVCGHRLDFIAGHVEEAIHALKTGAVSIKAIPAELTSSSKTIERVHWIKEQAAAKTQEMAP